MATMNIAVHPATGQAGGNFWKGLLVGLGCQLVYLLAVANLPHAVNRQTGFLLFGLLQLIYLYPLAARSYKRRHEWTAFGFIAVGILSLLGEAGWLGFAILHGAGSGLLAI